MTETRIQTMMSAQKKEKPSSAATYILAVLALIHAIVTGGCLFGWPAIMTMLNREGHYASLCPIDPVTGQQMLHCNDVEVYSSSIYSTALVVQSFVTLPLGLCLDWMGPRGAFSYQFVCVAGVFLMTVAGPYSGSGPDPLQAGFILLCTPGVSLVTLHLHIGNLLPRIRGVYCSVMSAAYGMSSVLFSLFELIQDTSGLSWAALLRIHLGLLIFFFFFTLILPKRNFHERDGCGFRLIPKRDETTGTLVWGFYCIPGAYALPAEETDHIVATLDSSNTDDSPSQRNLRHAADHKSKLPLASSLDPINKIVSSTSGEDEEERTPRDDKDDDQHPSAFQQQFSGGSRKSPAGAVDRHVSSQVSHESRASTAPSSPKSQKPAWKRQMAALLHELYEVWLLCRRPRFFLLVIVGVIWYFIASFYIASVHLQLSSIAFRILGSSVSAADAPNIEDVDTSLGNQVNDLNRIFTWLVCTGVAFAAASGAITDRFGFAAGWFIQVLIGILHLLVQFVPNLPVQIVVFFAYTGLQEICFALACSYTGIRLSWAYQNTLIGVFLFCCAAISLLINPIIQALVAARTMGTLFFPSLITFCVLGAVTFLYPYYVYKSEGIGPTTIAE